MSKKETIPFTIRYIHAETGHLKEFSGEIDKQSWIIFQKQVKRIIRRNIEKMLL